MNENSQAVIALCSYICPVIGVTPVEINEWAYIEGRLNEKGKTPSVILGFGAEDFKSTFGFDDAKATRMMRLLSRRNAVVAETERYASVGINTVTRFDSEYPHALKSKLGSAAPTMLYYAGDISATKNECIGIVGSRNVTEFDNDFVAEITRTSVNNGFSVVTGGAQGVDAVAADTAVKNGGIVVEYLADAMSRKIKSKIVQKRIRNGQLLMLSYISPESSFTVGMGMQRNKYIYAQSLGTVIVKADYNVGGTWSGALENLRNRWSRTYCRRCDDYRGNSELIRRGAIPIDEEFDPTDARKIYNEPKQLSFFDM